MNPWRVAGFVILPIGIGLFGLGAGYAGMFVLVMGLILLFGPTRTEPRRRRRGDAWGGVYYGSEHSSGWSDGGGDCGGGGGD